MANPPPRCYLLPLTKQMGGEKASPGDRGSVGLLSSLKGEGTSCPAQRHPGPALPCPSAQVLTETIHTLSSSIEKLILCNPLVDHSFYFSQSI